MAVSLPLLRPCLSVITDMILPMNDTASSMPASVREAALAAGACAASERLLPFCMQLTPPSTAAESKMPTCNCASVCKLLSNSVACAAASCSKTRNKMPETSPRNRQNGSTSPHLFASEPTSEPFADTASFMAPRLKNSSPNCQPSPQPRLGKSLCQRLPAASCQACEDQQGLGQVDGWKLDL